MLLRNLQVAGGLLIALLAVYLAHLAKLPGISRGSLFFTQTNGTHLWAPTVILLSLDGLKPAYLQSGDLPTLLRLSEGKKLYGENGVLSADFMRPVSPSLTFPNHWSLQTGLLPSSHGIVANEFHDSSPSTSEIHSFYYTDPSRSWDPKWWKGIAIWEQLEILNIKTANLMWPGPPRTRKNISSTYFQEYEKGWSLDDRLRKILSWLDREDTERPQFICAYAPDIDAVTHSLGPEVGIEAVSATLRAVDNFIHGLLQEIDKRDANHIVNVVFVSDHGMTSTSNARLLYLEDLLGDSLFSQIGLQDGWPNVGLRFTDQRLLQKAIVQLQKALKNESTYFKVANKEELVRLWSWEWTETVKERLAELWILPDVGWSITNREEMSAFRGDYHPKGNHGYDAETSDMAAFFLATGPAMRQKSLQKLHPFSNLEIHNLVMDLMRIPMKDRALNNGTISFWSKYLVR